MSLTGALGTESAALSNLFSGPAVYLVTGRRPLCSRLLNLNTIDANVQAATARREELVVNYRQTVQAAFKDVHDALAADRTTREALAARPSAARTCSRPTNCRTCRYKAGYSPYLEVLDAQRQLLQAQTLQILAARDVRLALSILRRRWAAAGNTSTRVEPRATAASAK